MSRVVATVGAIPGAGATTVVAGLGSALAEQRHHVALVDASAEGSRIANVLSLEGDGTVADALRRRADLAEVQASGPHDLSAFPADPDANWAAIRPGAVASTYETLRERFDIVLVDCGSEITPSSAPWLGYADELLVATDPDVPGAVQDVAGIGAAFDVPVLGLVANRVVRDELSAARSGLAETGEAVLAVLPEDPAVGAAAEERRSLLMEAPDSPIASCLWELGGRLSEGDHATPVVPEPWSDSVDGGASATESDATDDAGAAASGTTGGRSASGGTPSGSGSTGAGGGADAAIGSETATAPGSATPSSSESSTAGVDGSAGSVGATDGSASAGSSSTTNASTSASSSSASAGSTDAADVEPADDAAVGDVASTDGPDDAFEFSGTDDDGFGVGSGDATDAESTTTTTSESDSGSKAKAGSGAGTSTDAGSGTSAGSGTATQTSADVGTDGAGVGGDAASSAATPDPTESGSAGDADDGRAGGELEDDEATISDDEIEEVFKETMQRVKDEKDAESEDEDDSVLGGFMGD